MNQEMLLVDFTGLDATARHDLLSQFDMVMLGLPGRKSGSVSLTATNVLHKSQPREGKPQLFLVFASTQHKSQVIESNTLKALFDVENESGRNWEVLSVSVEPY